MPHSTVLLSAYTPLLYTLIITIIHLFIEMHLHHKKIVEIDEQHKARLEKLSLSDDWKFNITQTEIHTTQTEIRAIDERLTTLEEIVERLIISSNEHSVVATVMLTLMNAN